MDNTNNKNLLNQTLDAIGKELGELDPKKDRERIEAKKTEIWVLYLENRNYYRTILGKYGNLSDEELDEIFIDVFLEFLNNKFDRSRGDLSGFIKGHLKLRLLDSFEQEKGSVTSLDELQESKGEDTGVGDQEFIDPDMQNLENADMADNVFFELSSSILNFQKTGNKKSHNETYRKYCVMFYTGHLQGTLRGERLHRNKIYEHFQHPREILEQANTDILNYFTAQEVPYGNNDMNPAVNPVSLEKIAINPMKIYREVLSPKFLEIKKRGLDEEIEIPIPDPAYCGYVYYSEGREITEPAMSTQHAKFKEEFLNPLKKDYI